MARHESPSISVSRRWSVSAAAERTVLSMTGDHDMTTEGSISEAIARAARLDGGDVLIDLSGVTFMDASTVGAIVRAANLLRSRSQSLEVGPLSSSARRVLELCGPEFAASIASSRTVHPTGTAAALGTWVEVASAPAGGAPHSGPGSVAASVPARILDVALTSEPQP